MIHNIIIFFGGVLAGCWVGIILMALMVANGNSSVNDSSVNSNSGNNSKELEDSNNVSG